MYFWPIYSKLFTIEYIKIITTPIATAAATAVDAAVCFEFAQLSGRPKWKTMTVVACDRMIIYYLILLYGQNTIFDSSDGAWYSLVLPMLANFAVTSNTGTKTGDRTMSDFPSYLKYMYLNGNTIQPKIWTNSTYYKITYN